MDAGTLPARPTRTRYRHQLRSLAYLTLDQAYSGIVRNLTDQGIGVQLIAPLRPRQPLQVRFELREPRLRVEVLGEVVWCTSSGQCGIRFLDLPPRMVRQINEWILGNLLEGISLHTEATQNIFAASATTLVDCQADGLMVSATPVKVIELPLRRESPQSAPTYHSQTASHDQSEHDQGEHDQGEMDWLSRPLSGRAFALLVDVLVVLAGSLLVALVFLSVTQEAPRWPWRMAVADPFCVAALYWGFFQMFGGASMGARLARLNESNQGREEPTPGTRFR